MTIFIAITTLMYTYTRFIKLLEKNKADLVSYKVDNAITSEEKFTIEDGFYVAAAIT